MKNVRNSPQIPSLLLALAGLTLSSHAAGVIYAFESSDLSPTPSGTGFVAGSITETSLSAGVIYGSMSGGSVVRAYRPDQIANSTAPGTASADYISFTLIPDSGSYLDFTTASFTADLGAFTSSGSSGSMTIYTQLIYQIGATPLTTTGSVASVGQEAFTTPGSYTGVAGFNAAADLFDLTTGGLSVDLSLLGALAVDQTITFRVSIGDDSSSATALNAATNVKGVYLDNVGVSGFSFIPEPSAALLGGMGLLAILRRRRA